MSEITHTGHALTSTPSLRVLDILVKDSDWLLFQWESSPELRSVGAETTHFPPSLSLFLTNENPVLLRMTLRLHQKSLFYTILKFSSCKQGLSGDH